MPCAQIRVGSCSSEGHIDQKAQWPHALTRTTTQPSSLLCPTLTKASCTPSCSFIAAPRPVTACFRLASFCGSRAARLASSASASRTSASAFSAADKGAGEERWFKWEVRAEGVKSFCCVSYLCDAMQEYLRRWSKPKEHTREVANQSCLKLAAPRAFMRPPREEACSIFARTCPVSYSVPYRIHGQVN